MDIKELTPEQEEELYNRIKAKKENERNAQRDAYEAIRMNFMKNIFDGVDKKKIKGVFSLKKLITDFYEYIVSETDGFRDVMEEYGQLKNKQRSFTITQDDMKLEVKSNKVKKFDERADMAAARLVTFLKDWVKKSDKGTDDPMYQLAMMAIERNQKGDLDYKQVSNLYKLENKFNDTEYTAIMDLFRESHVVETNAVHFYFYKKSELGVWNRIEISFNRL